jgi:ABC-type branched-subunit amino acid transport system permease subunit
VTFAFALLVDQAVYTRDEFSNYGSGLPFARPTLFGMTFDTPKSFYWFGAAVMFIIMFVLWSLRRSTTGLVFATIRASRVRAATLGFDIFIARLGVFALGAAVAGIGGTMVASFQLVAFPNGYVMVIGLVWFALAVAQGTSSMGGLVAGGMTLLLMPAIFSEFLPERLADLPVLLFGLVAINMVKEPIGIQPNMRANMRKLAIKMSGGSLKKAEPKADEKSDSNVPAGV